MSAPLEPLSLPASQIRREVLLGLQRLHERGFERGSFVIPPEAIAVELEVPPVAVLSALDYLHEKGYIADPGTRDSNYRTGSYWLTATGIDHLEALDAAAPTTASQGSAPSCSWMSWA